MKKLIFMLRRYRYSKHRQHCRASLRIYTWVFGVLFLASPFVLLADTVPASGTGGVFGLDPEFVKLLLQGSILVIAWLLIRVLTRIDRSQNMLHQNDRELAKVLTQIVTAHNINHGDQGIQPPSIGVATEGDS